MSTQRPEVQLMTRRILRVLGFLTLCALSSHSQVIINEIMYHPSSENVAEEYIELHNRAGTNVNLTGWRISSGVQFTFAAGTVIQANGYLVVAAHRQTFTNKYPGVLNVVGNWVGILSNSRNDIDLDDANGDRIDSVEYADEGDWAIRRRGLVHVNHRGWIWYKEHDGLGKSLELVNPAMPNEHGQNWAASLPLQGTPGAQNSVLNGNIAPLILGVQHFPPVPSSSDVVTISARLLDESASGVTAELIWRVDGATFTSEPMFDDGAHGDGAAGDGLWAVTIGPHGNNTVIEFYVAAFDGSSNSRTWPAATLPATDQIGSPTQSANALYQVDDNQQNTFGGVPSQQPVFKMIMTEAERVELTSGIQGGDRNSDAQMNGTWISLDATGAEVRYNCGFRNRGHGSRGAGNFRANFSSDNPWQNVIGLNLNVVQVPIQHFGSVLALKSGAAGAYSRPAQVRVNNANRQGGSASYAANEAINSEWAKRHFPNDSNGNVYRAIRDIAPPTFDYRGENKDLYTNTWFKETNVSEDDWTDLVGMLRVLGLSGTDPFNSNSVAAVVNVEQWMTHLAVMNLMGNNETGLNSGYNDDYFMYRGLNDPRFILMYYDLDQILGQGGSMSANSGIFTCTANNGAGAALNRFIHDPSFEPIYYATLQRLLDTTFSAAQFEPLIDQTLGSYVSTATINAMKSWMNTRRSTVQSLINGFVPPPAGVATVTGEPRSPTPSRSATLIVGGNDIVSYRFKLNNGSYTGERLISSNIVFNNSLPNNSTNTIYVLGKTSAGGWQSVPTVSRTWIVNTLWPTVRLNEVLARNAGAINHNGTTPDYVELYNEGAASVDISGMRLTDDPNDPDKFTFPAGTTLASGAYLPLYANNADGTPGIHLGFSLNDQGDGVYLFHRASSGGALVDSVQFGAQLADLSIGRTNGGNSATWVLCIPSHNAVNIGVATGDRRNLRINEWLASPQSPFVNDFVEIFNPNFAPVDLGGLYLTDTPIGAPLRHRIPDLSFIPGGGYVSFTADGDNNEIDHVNFQLSSDVGEIALIAPGMQIIDCVSYGTQRPGVAVGRCGDGASRITFLVLPTPGSPNACPVIDPPSTVTLMNYNQNWKYVDAGTNLGTAWIDPGYDDSLWSSGPGLLGLDNDPQPEPIRTVFPSIAGKITYYFRTAVVVPAGLNISQVVFTHLIDDGAVFYLNGQELSPRFNMNSGAVDYLTPASQSVGLSTSPVAFQLPGTILPAGTNYLAVEVHQNTPQSPDVVFGLQIDAVVVTNTPSAAGLKINEVFANNGTFVEEDGSTPDWIEFYNPADSPVDLVGLSVSDTTLEPDRFVFPTGSVVPANGYFSVRMDADRPPSPTNTGFGLKASGDSLYLFNPNNAVLDFVNFGIQAADYSIGRNSGSNWNLCLPTIGDTNIPVLLGDVSRVRINEWMADPPPGEDDWFELYNPNPQPVAIGGCHLTDDLDDRLKHQIAPLSFLGANTNAWQRFIADGNIGAGADHVSFNLRSEGEAIGFATTTGVEIDKVTFGLQTPGVSQGRLLDGATSIVNFTGTPSPGDPNYVLMNSIVISEVLTHTDLPLEDAIEIRNIGATPVNVSGWWLSDSRGLPRKYQITNNSPVIPAGGFRVFYEYQFNDRDQTFLPFSLSSANGDEVYLSSSTNNALTGARAQAEFGAAENGVSFGRYVNSVGAVDYPVMPSLSLGTSVTAQSPSNQVTLALFRTGQGATNPYPKIGPLVITEIMYHPPDIGTNDNLIDEFVEIHNPTTALVTLYDTSAPTNRWRLRDGVDFDFPPNRSVPAGGYMVVVSFDPTSNPSALATFRARYPSTSNSILVGPYSGKLDNGGEGVKLLKPDVPEADGSVPFVLVDYVAYSDRAPWPTNADGFNASLQRRHALGYANDPTNWLAAAATPGPAGAPDSDGDGLPDSWEQQYFGTPTAGNPNADSDGDGMNNLQEYQAGTHPLSAISRLRISPLSVSKIGGTMTFQFSAVSNRTYTVHQANSLSGNSWTVLTTVAASPTNRTHTIVDSAAGSTGQRFYRVGTP
jgi:hypothetical protein